MSKKFYITTTLPYLNADPHIGHALEFVQADIIARFRRLMGDDVVFNTGTDEHGLKIFRKAFEIEMTPQAYADLYVKRFTVLKEVLNLSYTHFVRTTEPRHVAAAQEFWRRCFDNGDIYKKLYKTKYCVGCELEKHDSELDNGRCPLHPSLELETLEEENYFFRFSKYQPALLELYKSTPNFVVPTVRLKEISSFVERGLQDFSVSRLKEKMPWGVPIVDDPDHVMYVWFDALVSYISTLDWPTSEQAFKYFWPGMQLAGKDNLRQQAAMWQAMLLSAKLPPSKQILIHGHATSGGKKMSKTAGNVVDPIKIVEQYGTDAFRYYVAREMSPFEDSDFTEERFKETYNANLANGLGNLTSRIMKLAETYLDKGPELPGALGADEWPKEITEAFTSFELNKYADYVWMRINDLDKQIQETEPFKVVKVNPEEGKELISALVEELNLIALMLEPLLPSTSATIKDLIKTNKSPAKPLFLRKD